MNLPADACVICFAPLQRPIPLNFSPNCFRLTPFASRYTVGVISKLRFSKEIHAPPTFEDRNWKIFLRWTGSTLQPPSLLRSALRSKILETQKGNSISLQNAYALANVEGDDLLGLLAAANLLRAELCGNLVTYVVNRNINFTNICFVGMQVLRLQPRARASPTRIFSSPIKSRKRLSRPGNLARQKFAFRVGYHMACRHFTIATFCAR